MDKRMQLAINFLSKLKENNSQLTVISSEIKEHSRVFYRSFVSEHKHGIQHEIDRYKSNIEKIKSCNHEITWTINSWYDFLKDNKEACKIFFPVNYFYKKKKLNNSIKKLNKDISDTTIENRLAKEHIAQWEVELKEKASEELRRDKRFSDYQRLLDEKNELLSQLKYLLPTIPGLCPVEIRMADIDSLIAKLNKDVLQ